MFFRVVLSGLLVMSAYVGWRSGSVPVVRRYLPWYLRAILLLFLAASYMLARDAEDAGWTTAARLLELVGAHWMGILLLLTVAMLAADLATGFGFFFRRHLASIRGWALVAGAVLSLVALVQGSRAPVVRDHEVVLPGLRAEDDGLVLVFLSDTHLGSLIGERWLNARIAQVSALEADAIILGGDILEGDSPSERELLPVLARLSAPLGVWAVAGNHDHHGSGGTLEDLERRGFRVLRNEWIELRPGLILAGVDGGRGRRTGGPARPASSRQPGAPGTSSDRLGQTLAGRPPGSPAILISHAPSGVEDAADAGVSLMLSGHTHGGQIWPFRYVVRTQFRYLAGRYDVAGMPLIVCRGTGTFGPRMRLWYPSEILRVTLRAAPSAAVRRPESTPACSRTPADLTAALNLRLQPVRCSGWFGTRSPDPTWP